MTDVIFAQVIFSRQRASSCNFENKEKHNMNLRFIEIYRSIMCKKFLSEFPFYFSYTKMNFRHVFLGPPGISLNNIQVKRVSYQKHLGIILGERLNF